MLSSCEIWRFNWLNQWVCTNIESFFFLDLSSDQFSEITSLFFKVPAMKSIAWKTFCNTFPYFLLTISRRKLFHYDYGSHASMQPTSSQKRFNLIAEITGIMRILQPPSLESEYADNLQAACHAFQAQLEKDDGVETKQQLEMFMTFPFTRFCICKTYLRWCGMVWNFWLLSYWTDGQKLKG